jgi:enterochelin esterase-like enzyme
MRQLIITFIILSHSSLFAQMTTMATYLPEITTVTLANGHQLQRISYEQCGQLAGRKVDIWIPKNLSPGTPLAVMYAHDGQNLFDPNSSYGGESWLLHETAQSLIDAGKIKPVMIVGIWNSSQRFREYLPAPAVNGLLPDAREKLAKERGDSALSDAYLDWITQELKPFIDSNFPTYGDMENTYMIGSSMGGLISSYSLSRHHQLFIGAACLSTHWPISLSINDTSLSGPYRRYLAQQLPRSGRHKLWMDYGTATLDAWYEPHQVAFNKLLLTQKTWKNSQNYMCKKYENAPHNEQAWRARSAEVLTFLLSP